MLQLQQARQQALEAEEVADGVMTNLSTQRDVVNKMKANMRTIGAELSSARQSIGRMLQPPSCSFSGRYVVTLGLAVQRRMKAGAGRVESALAGVGPRNGEF